MTLDAPGCSYQSMCGSTYFHLSVVVIIGDHQGGINVMEHVKEYMEWITGVLGFILGSGFTMAIQRVRQGHNANFADQRNSKVGGDQAGRDIKK